MTSSKKRWMGAFDSLKDIKEYLAELECAFAKRESEKTCNKWLISIKNELIQHEDSLKELRRLDEQRRKKTPVGKTKVSKKKNSKMRRANEKEKPQKKAKSKTRTEKRD